MTQARELRNPYVILGLAFGASAEEARKALPSVLRRVRAGQDLAYSIEDVTWALHQIEAEALDPSQSTSIYRIPANARALQEVVPEGGALFKPKPSVPVLPVEPLEVAVRRQWHLAVLEQIAAIVEEESGRLDLAPNYGGM